ncbi:MAG: ABC transporter substrate binding protein [Desulfuromusa sp.]
MDTKRNISEKYKKEAALKVKKLIEQWRPDIVIASDDNASKYLVAPYYRDSDLPFVFCGINGSADPYGFPTKNITGMVEVALVEEGVKALRNLTTKNRRIGFIAADVTSTHQILDYGRTIINIPPERVHFVTTMEQWQSAYLQLQRTADILLVGPWNGISGWDEKENVAFILENSRIPSVSFYNYMYQYSLLSFGTLAEEQGEYAAKTALAILDGEKPANFPIVRNHKAKILLNMKLAKKMGIKFPISLVQNASFISATKKKLLYVNSYHHGYGWSDGIESGLLKALSITVRDDGSFDTTDSDVEIKMAYMDTKRNPGETFKKQAALKVKSVIDEWQPDIVVASDDNASMYLIAPYYRNSELPFVFCGVNYSADQYGFPTDNITGMVEISPTLQVLKALKPYAQGERVGYLGTNVLAGRKDVEWLLLQPDINLVVTRLVDTFAEWKKSYLKLQESVDMLLMINPLSVSGWNHEEAVRFVLEETKIPSGTTLLQAVPYVLLGHVMVAEEQGWWAGKTALKILKGILPSQIPLTRNQSSSYYLNMELAKKLKIQITMQDIKNATFVDMEKR